MRPLRWGVLGVARVIRRLAPAFRHCACAVPRAVASRSADRARQAAADWGFETAHGSYEALLADPTVDAVYIPLPNALHPEWVVRTAEAGKHVLCEKPLCPTAAEAADVIAYCRARGVRLMEGFMWPHHPRTHHVRRAINEGRIGPVRRVTGAFTFPLDLGSANVRLRADLAGGSLLDVGCYPVFAIRWAMGAQPVGAFARASFRDGVDVEFSGLLWFEDGQTAAFDCGFTTPYRGWLEVVGTDGTIRVPRLWAPAERATWELERTGAAVEEHAVEGEDQVRRMLEEFAAAVAEGRDPRPGPDESVKTLRVVDALRESARAGQPVAVGS